jgi:hypothetical protein
MYVTKKISFVCGRQGSGLRENGGEWSRVGFMRASAPVYTVGCVDAAKFSDPVRNGAMDMSTCLSTQYNMQNKLKYAAA